MTLKSSTIWRGDTKTSKDNNYFVIKISEETAEIKNCFRVEDKVGVVRFATYPEDGETFLAFGNIIVSFNGKMTPDGDMKVHFKSSHRDISNLKVKFFTDFGEGIKTHIIGNARISSSDDPDEECEHLTVTKSLINDYKFEDGAFNVNFQLIF